MNEQNVQASVLRALRAYKLEQGMTDAAATAWATANLNAGVVRVMPIMAQYKVNPETGVLAAFADLKAWAQTQS